MSTHCGNCFGQGHSEKNCGAKPRKKKKSVSKKYLDHYNYHDWSGFIIKKPEQMPTGPHFAAVLFEKEHRRDHDPYTGNYQDVEYMATVYFSFPDKQTLTEWVTRAAKAEKKFFCFEVKKIGGVQIKVNVDVEV